MSQGEIVGATLMIVGLISTIVGAIIIAIARSGC